MSADLSARSISRAEGVDAVRALQRVLYRSAKQNPTRRFHALYDKVARSDILWRAWIDVATNAGAPGVDGVSIDAVAAVGVAGVRAFLDELAAELRAKAYRPQPLRRVHIPKPGKPGEFRPLGIPTVRDRVVMAAAKLVLEPVFEADFAPSSFGFRPKRSAHDAIEAIRVEANRGRDWVLDADIKACFDNIDHDALMAQVARRVSDRDMLKLLRCWLRTGIFEGGVVSDVDAGTPQGSPISPLLANIALHVLDVAWRTDSARIGVLVRYADDLVVLCATRRQTEEAQRRVAAVLAGLGLWLHPDKTRIVRLTQGQQGFDFLGFHHQKVESWRWRGKHYLQSWPSDRAMNSIRAKIRDRTDRRHVGRSVEQVVADLNPVLRGAAHTSAEETRPGSSATSTATSTYGWPSSPAPSTDSRAATGSDDSAAAGCETSASTSLSGRCTTGLRMPDDERCWRAVCGRTARTVRQGAAGEADDLGGGRWSRAGVLRDATTMARSGPQPPNADPPSQRPTSPIYCFADATGETLAVRLRPGNAGANDIADHVTVLDGAIAQLPEEIAVGHRPGDDPSLARRAVRVRVDSAGCTDFVRHARARNVGFAVVARSNASIHAAISRVVSDDDAWQPALRQDGDERPGAAVAELTDLVDLSDWPDGTRLIVRREPLHPGAQQSLFPSTMFRYWGHYTDADGDPVHLDVHMRAHAHVEDHIRRLKDSGAGRFPFCDIDANRAWLAVVCFADTLVRWFQLLCLTGTLAVAEPKTLRWGLWHAPARLVHKAGRRVVRILDGWPTTAALLAAHQRIALIT